MLEFLLKHVGLGPVGYWSEPWNLLDGGIVLLSVVELIMLYAVASDGSNTQALRTFRLLRILRALRLLARIEPLRKLMRLVLQVRRARMHAGGGGGLMPPSEPVPLVL